MNFSSLIILLLVCFTSSISARGRKFALLVATTKSWLNYRHQSTVLHAYQTLIANGFRKDNIITMLYDDIAYHPNNKEPGVIRNHPNGANVNENAKKDYTGEKVNANVMLGILNGNASIAQGPVFEGTNAKDNLFIYFVGFTYGGSLIFSKSSRLERDVFVKTLLDLRAENKFGKIYVMLESAFGEIIVDRMIPTDSKIIVNVATSEVEYPYAVYCDTKNQLCRGSLFGVTWTEYSDRLRQLPSGRKATIFDQYDHVRYRIPFTHVSLYGDLSLGSTRLSEFLNYKHEKRPAKDVKVGFAEFEDNDFPSESPTFGGYSDDNIIVRKERNHIHKDEIDNILKNFIVRVEEEKEDIRSRSSSKRNVDIYEQSF